jgi:hypothetical protein
MVPSATPDSPMGSYMLIAELGRVKSMRIPWTCMMERGNQCNIKVENDGGGAGKSMRSFSQGFSKFATPPELEPVSAAPERSGSLGWWNPAGPSRVNVSFFLRITSANDDHLQGAKDPRGPVGMTTTRKRGLRGSQPPLGGLTK